jgi:hypothetical protein
MVPVLLINASRGGLVVAAELEVHCHGARTARPGRGSWRNDLRNHIRMKDDRPFALTGRWERWTNSEGATLESCAIITTAANDLLRPFHDRMPAILAPGVYGT